MIDNDKKQLNFHEIKHLAKILYSCDIFMENFFDVVLQHVLLSFCYNFFSKDGLVFIAIGLITGVFKITNVSISIIIALLPSIIVLSDIPVLYTVNSVKLIKKLKYDNKKERNNEINIVNEKIKEDSIQEEVIVNKEINELETNKVIVRIRTK